MPKILVTSPDPEFSQLIKQVGKELNFEEQNLEVKIIEAVLDDAAKLVHEAVTKDEYEVLVSRGGTAEAIKKIVDVPVITAEFNDFDLLQALWRAQKLGDRIGYLGTAFGVSYEFGELKDILGIEIKQYRYRNFKEIEQQVALAHEDGMQVMVGGGAWGQQLSNAKGMKGVLICSSHRTVTQALERAVEVIKIRRRDREYSRMLRDMELARQIQLSLLPASPPELAGVMLAGCCVPAAHVGGDYYDYYRREDGLVDMVIADVSGHSIGAALMMVEFRSILRSSVQSFSSTGDMLVFLNDLLYEDLNQSGLFITLFFIKYDPLSRTLSYSNAGHTLPLLVPMDDRGDCRELDSEGLILGIKKGVEFEEKKVRMQAGDLLVLYTDGIIEAEGSAGEMFGIDRLRAIIQARRSEPPQAIIDAVFKEVSIFRGAKLQEDDETMIVMKVV